MSLLKKIQDKYGVIHEIGDSRVDAFETELTGGEHNVPYSPAVLSKTNAIEQKIDDHAANVANPHGVTKEQLGLANVENKSSTQIRSELTKENVTNALGYTPIDESRIGAANGVASLDAGGRIPASQIPGGFDNIDEYDSLADFPETGEEGKIYVAKDTNLTYRWTGTQYIEISPSLALGETATTAYRGDRGKAAYDHSQISGDSTIHHTHANKELLDSYTQTEADLANAVAKVHEHGNKAVLDGITADKVSAWDSKQQALTFDDTPTAGSTNPVTSGGIKTAIDDLENIRSGKIGGSKAPTAGQVAKLATINWSSMSTAGAEFVGSVSYILNSYTSSSPVKAYSSNFIIAMTSSRVKYSLTMDNPLCAGMLKMVLDEQAKTVDLYLVAPVDGTSFSVGLLTIDSFREGYQSRSYPPSKYVTYHTYYSNTENLWSSTVPEWTPWFSEIYGMSAGSESVPVYLENGIAKEATGVATKEELEAQGIVVLNYGQTPTKKDGTAYTFAELKAIAKQLRLFVLSGQYVNVNLSSITDSKISWSRIGESGRVNNVDLSSSLVWSDSYVEMAKKSDVTDEAAARKDADAILQTAIDAKQDKLSKTDAEITDAVDKAHSHGNKDVLDGITSDKVNSWDGKEDAFNVLPTTKGGTGTNAASVSALTSTLINSLSSVASTPRDADYYVAQYAGGGTTTTTYHRRPVSALWNYIKGKISSVLGLTESNYAGKAATAGTADKAVADNSGNNIVNTYATKTELNAKQNNLTAGDNITIDGNTISSDQIFVATYGTTKYTEVKAAYDAGKICTVFKDKRYYYIKWIDTTFIVFASSNGKDTLHSVSLGSGNTWSTYTGQLQSKLTFDAVPTAGSNNPVTSKGIKTAIDTIDAKGITVKEISGEQVICFE